MTTTRGAFVIVDKIPPANDAQAFCWVLPATPGMEFVRGVPTELPGDAQPVAPGEHTVPACAQQFHARIVQGTVMTRDHNSGTALIVRDAKPSGASSLEAMSRMLFNDDFKVHFLDERCAASLQHADIVVITGATHMFFNDDFAGDPPDAIPFRMLLYLDIPVEDARRAAACLETVRAFRTAAEAFLRCVRINWAWPISLQLSRTDNEARLRAIRLRILTAPVQLRAGRVTLSSEVTRFIEAFV